jgi:hypothetical protein
LLQRAEVSELRITNHKLEDYDELDDIF